MTFVKNLSYKKYFTTKIIKKQVFCDRINNMNTVIPKKLKTLAKILPAPLYVVGGFVRNALFGDVVSEDIDLSSALTLEEFLPAAQKAGFYLVAVYKTTQTAVVSDGKRHYEYACFREETYASGGGHTPLFTQATDDIIKDALRRDSKCNAVYYDVAAEKIVDPLGGVEDIKKGVIDTVKSPREVFSRDGLRLMRLARFVSETGFVPTAETIAGAREFAANIKDVAAERVYAELRKILVGDGKYPFSPKDGHYRGIKILDETRVLDYIFPELTAGRGMVQRKDYHDHDVLEHSLRAVLYARSDIRLAALLHDIGKPYQMINTGRYKGHAEIGETLAVTALKRLKADKKTTEEVAFLTANHMRDLDGKERKCKLRRLFVDNYGYAEKLIALKYADGAACKDDINESPSVKKWREIYEELKTDGTPLKIKDLAVSSKDVIAAGLTGKAAGEELKKLQSLCIENPKRNDKDYLLKKINRDAAARGVKTVDKKK